MFVLVSWLWAVKHGRPYIPGFQMAHWLFLRAGAGAADGLSVFPVLCHDCECSRTVVSISRGYIFSDFGHLSFLHNENDTIQNHIFSDSVTLETVGSLVSHLNLDWK